MFNIRLEYKLADMWIGLFWRKGEITIPQGNPSCAFPVCKVVEVWICLIPCFPIHIQWIDSQSFKNGDKK